MPYYYHYVRITNIGVGCMTNIGYNHRAAQSMNLGSSCRKIGVVMHEALHTLGFVHQHNVPDRDQYVYVYWQNIRQEAQDQFQKYPAYYISSLGFPYDYGSIMHYGTNFANINGQVTLYGKYSGAQQMGQREALSPTDYAKINVLYKCPTNYG